MSAFFNFAINLLHFIAYFMLWISGTDSPQAVRKLMSLSEPGKTRQRRAKHSVSSLHSMNSPPASPPPINAKKVKGHERSQSDCSVTPPVCLSAESSSVTSLQSRIKNANHILTKGKFHKRRFQAVIVNFCRFDDDCGQFGRSRITAILLIMVNFDNFS